MKSLGLFGFGRIGKFLALHLKNDFDLSIYEVDQKKQAEIKGLALKCEGLSAVAKKDIVLVAVPISSFEEAVKEIAPHLNPGTIFVDVCSVKETPLEIMKKYLPSSIDILATHPMFGPDSAKESLKGSKIVLCPFRISPPRLQKVEDYLKSLGLLVIKTSATDHDEQISQSLVLAHFIGRALIGMEAKNLLIDTKGYQRLMKILETVENDSYQLFLDMNKHNKFAKVARGKFLSALQKIEGELSK
jgi:prephenate dehydrogenase